MVLNLSYLNNILRCCHEFETVINVTAGSVVSTTLSSWPLSFKSYSEQDSSQRSNITFIPLHITTITLGSISGNSWKFKAKCYVLIWP